MALIIRQDGSDRKWKALPNRMIESKELPKNFHAVKTPPPEVKNFYNDGGGDESQR